MARKAAKGRANAHLHVLCLSAMFTLLSALCTLLAGIAVVCAWVMAWVCDGTAHSRECEHLVRYAQALIVLVASDYAFRRNRFEGVAACFLKRLSGPCVSYACCAG